MNDDAPKHVGLITADIATAISALPPETEVWLYNGEWIEMYRAIDLTYDEESGRVIINTGYPPGAEAVLHE